MYSVYDFMIMMMMIIIIIIIIIIAKCCNSKLSLANSLAFKPGFHYPSSRPEFTGRVDGP